MACFYKVCAPAGGFLTVFAGKDMYELNDLDDTVYMDIKEEFYGINK